MILLTCAWKHVYTEFKVSSLYVWGVRQYVSLVINGYVHHDFPFRLCIKSNRN
jgi:hypothetical protein